MNLVRTLLFLFSAVGLIRGADPAGLRLPRGTPEEQGVSSAALLDFVENAEAKLNALHSFMLVRHGQVIAEGWWTPYAAEYPHEMFSLSKSFTSTAVGLAVADRKLSVDDPVLNFFPEEAPANPSANLKAMRVRDLLTMSTGHHSEDLKNFPFVSDENPVAKFLALPVAHKPGTLFVYNTPASFMLSAIVQKVTGQSVLAYLQPRLFEPLGISEPTWAASKQGVSLGGFGLSVRTEDVAKLGQLYLQKGKWQGTQLLPETWVEAATSRQVSNGSAPNSDSEQGYGYQFWRCRHGFYRGDGANGQFCIVMPQFDAVIAITSGTRNMASVMDLVWEKIVPALQSGVLATNAEAHRKLTAKLAALTLPPQTAAPNAKNIALAQRIAGKRYLFPKNPLQVETVKFEPSGSGDIAGSVTQTVRLAGTEQQLTITPGIWRKTELRIGSESDPIAISGAWTGDDAYTLQIVRYRTPLRMTYHMTFADDAMTIDSESNIGPASMRPPTITGKAE